MLIRLNGGDHQAPEGATILGLLETMRLQPGRVAVEVNGRIIARADFQRVVLREGDILEVVHFVGGG